MLWCWYASEMETAETPESALTRAIEIAGGQSALARKIGAKGRQNVHIWKRVPAEHVPVVSRVTGIPQYKLRPDLPDLFPPPTKKSPEPA